DAAISAAIEIGDNGLVTRLLKEGSKGASIGACLKWAIKLGDESLVKSLVEAGATTSVLWDRYSYVDRNLPKIAIIRLLLETGALLKVDQFLILPMTAHIEYGTIIADILSAFFDVWGSIRLFSRKEYGVFTLSNEKALKNCLKSNVLYQALSHENSRKWILTSGFATIGLLTDSLIVGIVRDDVEFVNSLINAGADIFDQLTLEIAATYRPHFLRTLIQYGRQGSGQMPRQRVGPNVIKRAIRQGPEALNAIRYLIDSGEVELANSGSVVDDILRTPLGEAINIFKEFPVFSYDVVKMLLESGCDPNSIVEHHLDLEDGHSGEVVSCENVTALLKSMETEDKGMVQLLIDRGAHVNGKIPYFVRRTPLQEAAGIGNMEIIDLLLDHGADINADPAFGYGGTALQLAAIFGDCHIAAELLRRGALLHKFPSKVGGRWPIEGAAEHGRFEMIQFLWKANSEIIILQDGDNGFEEQHLRKAMKLAAEHRHYDCRDLIAELSGLDPTATDLPPKAGPIHIDWPPPGWPVEVGEDDTVHL
ncbi:ankyrin repeat-containing domain protein, partial [Xylaria flabelliformis]